MYVIIYCTLNQGLVDCYHFTYLKSKKYNIRVINVRSGRVYFTLSCHSMKPTQPENKTLKLALGLITN